MKLTELQYVVLSISLVALGQADLHGNEIEELRTLEYLLEEALGNVRRTISPADTRAGQLADEPDRAFDISGRDYDQ